MKHILDSVRPSFTTIHALALALAVTGGAPRGMAQGLTASTLPRMWIGMSIGLGWSVTATTSARG